LDVIALLSEKKFHSFDHAIPPTQQHILFLLVNFRERRRRKCHGIFEKPKNASMKMMRVRKSFLSHIPPPTPPKNHFRVKQAEGKIFLSFEPKMMMKGKKLHNKKKRTIEKN
jgi:hypothetical protein